MQTFPKTVLKTVLLFALFAAASLHAGATVIVGTPTPVADAIQIPAVNYFGPGPIAYSDYIWSSNNADLNGGSVFGFTGFYGFLDNGFWDGALGPMAGLNDALANAMTFTFTTPVYEIGDFFNYAPGGFDPTTLAVYSQTGQLIESYDLSFLTGDGANGIDLGEWITFRESTPIAYFRLTGNYVGLADPTSLTTTPEPGSFLLLASGAVGLAGAMRRKLAKG